MPIQRPADVTHKTDSLEKSLALVRSTLESTQDGILIVSKEGAIVDCNKKFVEMWRIPKEIMESGNDAQALQFVLSQVSDPQGFYQKVTKLYEHEDEKENLGEVTFIDGRVFERYSQPHIVQDEIVGRVWSFRDITEQKKREDTLRLCQRAIESSYHGIILVEVNDKDNPIIYVNPAFEKITGYTAAEVIGKNCRFLQGGDIQQAEITKLRLAIKEKHEEKVILRNYRKDSTLFWNELYISPVPDAKGNITHYVGAMADITERKNMENQLLFQATHDALTNLPNKALLVDRMQQAIMYTKENKTIIGVVFIDLDRFKLVNDTLGHLLSDELLKIAAKRLVRCVREEDTIARMGGDEFVVLLTHIHKEEDVVSIAKKLLATLSCPFKIKDYEFNLTASLGVSFYPKDGEEVDVLIKNADIAMYRAKDIGRNSIQIFNIKMNDEISKRANIEANLRNSLKNKELVLFYQPVVDAKTQRVTSCEALLRWNHPELGMISPLDFIPIAEDNGLILPIGEWVMEQACKQLKFWHEHGFQDLKISVNLSGRQLAQRDIAKTIEKILIITGLNPEHLDIELTESILLDNADESIAKLQQLKELGISLSIDDFGTGYSSLNYLKRFPVDMLKIDKSFIDDIEKSANDQAIVKAIINLANTLEISTTAEGVEKEGQFNILKSLGCKRIQGFLFSKPVKDTEFFDLLKISNFNYSINKDESIA